jgi:kynurenine formamidase
MLGRPGLGVAADSWKVSHHGFAFTHVDALCHFPFDGKNFNGFPLSETTMAGCAKDDVTQMRDGILTRGVLIDIPRLKGLPYLDAPTAITREDVQAWLKHVRLKLEPGDAILFRTGRWAQRAEEGPTNLQRSSAGVHVSVVPLLRHADIAVAGSDVGIDIAPSGVEGQGNPVHTALLAVLGVPLLDNADLEAAAETAARLKRWEFLLTLNPVPVIGGTGGLVNAVATF